jgi:ABC-type branched-subunit amino acid transport system ATPase component/branched-subunit amino acid ABC-type transport system permease component
MSQFLALVVTGAASGAVYALIAVCLTHSYQTTGIFNLGYGAIAFVAALFYYQLHTGLGLPIAISAIITVLMVSPGIGFLLNKFIFRRITSADDSVKIMCTIGVAIFLPNLAYVIQQSINGLGANLPDSTQIASPPGLGPTPPVNWRSGLIVINSDQVIVLLIAALAAFGMWFMMRRTRLGLEMRAVVDRNGLAQMRGVNADRMSLIAWLIGSLLAGLTGVAAAPIFGVLTPDQYNLMMFIAVAAAVVGGFRHVPVAFAAGLGLGVLISLIAGYATFADQIQGFAESVPFVVLLIGLAIWGKSRGRVANTAGTLKVLIDPRTDIGRLRRAWPWTASYAGLLIWALLLANSFWLGQITLGLALSVVFLSFVLITGLGGIVSLAQAAFVTLAGMTAGLATDHFSLPFLLAVVIGVVAASLAGLLVVLPALRLGGLALALATLALGFVGDYVLFQWNWFSNSTNGWIIAPPKFGFINLANPKTFVIILFLIVPGAVLLVRNVANSLTGRAAIAVNSSEPAARMSGISPAVVKAFVVAVGGGLAGFGGILLTLSTGVAESSAYTTQIGLVWLAIIVLQGVRSPGGAVLAGMIGAIVPALVSSGFHFGVLAWNGTTDVYIPNALFGLGAIGMAKNPEGIVEMNARMFRALRDWRKSRVTGVRRVSLLAAGPAGIVGAAAGVTFAGSSNHVAGVAAVAPVAPTATVAPAAADVRPPSESIALSVDRICASYGPISVLKDVSIDIARGTITAIVGPNGAGKSTFCSVVSGSLAPTSGRISFNGRDITDLNASERAKTGVVLAPESRGIFPGLSVEDNLMLRLTTAPERDMAFDRFPILATRRKLAAGNLSGGEQQMLAMASLLIRPPAVLIADEPTLGLAPRIAAEVIELFVELREHGVSLLVVEERARLILEIVDKVAVIELGQISWAGDRSSLADEDLLSAYLGGRSSDVGDAVADEPKG